MSANTDKTVKLYYEFGGSIDWLREEIIKKRYDAFRYLLPVKNKEKQISYLKFIQMIIRMWSI